MKKLKKLVIVVVIIITIFILLGYREKFQNENDKRGVNKSNEIISVQIIDKNNQLENLYENATKEEYIIVDFMLNDIYYKDVGLRTKGSSVYTHLKNMKSDYYSFKVKLDYMNSAQTFNGFSEFYINRSVNDPTGIREFLVYDMYNEMGIETQQYFLGNLKINDIDSGLITIVEVINEDYIEYKYGTKIENVYKPEIPLDEYGLFIDEFDISAGLNYLGEESENYKGIFNNIDTIETSEEDKIRLINIIKNINENPTVEVVEKNFINFDEIIKKIAVNRVMGNIDDFTGINIRNYYLYETNGKIDILPFDFDLSLGLNPIPHFFGEHAGELDIFPNEIEPTKSVIIKIILENQEYMKKFENYLKEALNKLEEINLEKKVDEINLQVVDIVRKNNNRFHAFRDYLDGIEEIKSFIKNRVNH